MDGRVAEHTYVAEYGVCSPDVTISTTGSLSNILTRRQVPSREEDLHVRDGRNGGNNEAGRFYLWLGRQLCR